VSFGIAHNPIHVSDLAVEQKRLFPESRHRSARVLKKLIKRFGSEFRDVPCVIHMATGGLIMHSVLYAQLQRELPSRINVDELIKSTPGSVRR
jgi:hypothetical protein